MDNNKKISPEATQEFKPMIKFEVGMKAYFRNPVNDKVEEGTIMDIDPKTGKWAVMAEDLSMVTDIDGEKAAKLNYDKSKENPTIPGINDRPIALSKEDISEEEEKAIGEMIE